jgi:hypothetical protein
MIGGETRTHFTPPPIRAKSRHRISSPFASTPLLDVTSDQCDIRTEHPLLTCLCVPCFNRWIENPVGL